MSAQEEVADLLQLPTVAPLPTPAPSAEKQVRWNHYQLEGQTVPFSSVLDEKTTLPGLSFAKQLALRTKNFRYVATKSLASADTGGYFQVLADALLNRFSSKCLAAACQGSECAAMDFVIDEKSLTSVVPNNSWSDQIQRLWKKATANPDGHFFLRRFRDRVVTTLKLRASIKEFFCLFVDAPLLPSRLDMQREVGPGDWNQYIEEIRDYDPSSVKIVVKLGMPWMSSAENDWATKQVNTVRVAHKRMYDERMASAAKKPRYEVGREVEG